MVFDVMNDHLGSNKQQAITWYTEIADPAYASAEFTGMETTESTEI